MTTGTASLNVSPTGSGYLNGWSNTPITNGFTTTFVIQYYSNTQFQDLDPTNSYITNITINGQPANPSSFQYGNSNFTLFQIGFSVTVQVTYNYNPSISFINGTNISISGLLNFGDVQSFNFTLTYPPIPVSIPNISYNTGTPTIAEIFSS